MSFPPHNELNQDRVFSNADSFAMAFDDAWKSLDIRGDLKDLQEDEKIAKVFERIQNHPLIKETKNEAYAIAKFRIKLLKLD